MAPKLNQRIQICTAVLTPNSDASIIQSQDFTLIKELWAELIESSALTSNYVRAIRSQNTEEFDTHYFKIRKSSMDLIGAEFTQAFGDGFDAGSRSTPIKSDYYIKLLRGTATRLFRVTGTQVDDQNKEYIKIRTSEVEEDR